MTHLLDDPAVVQRIFDHIDHETTDLAPTVWREPVANYRSEARLAAEVTQVLRRRATLFCPSAALPEPGSYVARAAAGVPVLVVRGQDGQVRAFRNACRHRGATVAQGSGCAKSLVCPYHGWTYRLDGRLRHVPHDHGFPDLDRDTRGLVPLAVVERHGLVFVGPAASDDADPVALELDGLEELAGVVTDDHRLVVAVENEQTVNWKVLVESFLEGYHIRSTHRETFFPLQFDNLNVVEAFGPHSRVAFPYRNIGKLRSVPPAERRTGGTLTFVYHLFPNGIVATFPDQIVAVVMDPLAVDRTSQVTYVLTPGTDPQRAGRPVTPGTARSSGSAGSPAAAGVSGAVGAAGPDDRDQPRPTGPELVLAGAVEDNAMVAAVQQGLASEANEYLEFGLFEGAIGHFHRTLDAALGESVSVGRETR